MKSQSQITIYSLNDVVTQTTAPSNPYKGQLWVDTSKTPPLTMVYNGTKWVEQNGTDTIRTSVKTVEDKQAEFKTSLDGLTSTVGSQTKTIETIESDIDGIQEDVTSITSDISTLQQTTTEISADVSNKADSQYGSSSSSFGWKLKSTGFELYSNKKTVMKVTSSGLEVAGKVTATSGSIGNLTITGQLTFGGNDEYYINPNYDDDSYYINLPGIRIDDASGAVFSGTLSAPGGNIGGFSLTEKGLSSGTWGTDGSILLSKGSTESKSIGGSSNISGWVMTAGANFGVTKAGTVYANDVYLQGDVYATSGYFENCEMADSCTIYGYLYMSGSEEVKFYGTKMVMNYETWIGGSGIATEIRHTLSNVEHVSYGYNRPFGMTIVPYDYRTYSNDGMIFGIMESYSFKTQNLLAGSAYFFKFDGTNVYSEAMFKCGDSFLINATMDSVNDSAVAYFGGGSFDNYLNGRWYISDGLYPSDSSSYIGSKYVSGVNYGCFYGRWHFDNYVYFGTSTQGHLYTTNQNGVLYPFLGGTWYANTLYTGTYGGYHLRIDGDQVTFFYSTKECGDIECYSTYVDIQGTFKTNGNNWISSSDRNLKKDIRPIDEIYDDLFDRLNPVLFRWKDGTSGRIHTGFIAQDVKQATEDTGLTTSDFGAYVHFAASEKDGEIIPESCGIRYEEITPLNTWEIQKLKRRVKELEDKMEELQNENH